LRSVRQISTVASPRATWRECRSRARRGGAARPREPSSAQQRRARPVCDRSRYPSSDEEERSRRRSEAWLTWAQRLEPGLARKATVLEPRNRRCRPRSLVSGIPARTPGRTSPVGARPSADTIGATQSTGRAGEPYAIVSPAHERIAGMSLATTGVPSANASRIGRPNPSASDGKSRARALASQRRVASRV